MESTSSKMLQRFLKRRRCPSDVYKTVAIVAFNDWWSLSKDRKEYLSFIKYGYYMDDISTLEFESYEKINDLVIIHRSKGGMIYKVTPSTCEYLGVQK